MIPKYYVINLAEKHERWERMLQLSSELGVNFSRIEAVTPKEIPISSSFSEIFNCFLSPQQLACYYSHHKVWEKIAEGPEEFGILLEDDIVLSEDILRMVEGLTKSQLEFDVIRLEATYKGDFIISDRNLISLNGIQIGRIYSASTGSAALIISKKGAYKLLNIALPVLPVDELLFNKYSPIWNKLINFQVKQILAWQLFSLGLNTIKGFESSIYFPAQSKRKKKKSIKTSIKKLIIKIKYLYKLRLTKTRKIVLDKSRKKKLEEKEKNRFLKV